MYDEAQNEWTVLAWQLPFGIEGAAILQRSDSQVLIFGGREYLSCSNKVRSLTIRPKPDKKAATGAPAYEGSLMEIGDIGAERWQHKIALLPKKEDAAFLFGGDLAQPVQRFSLQKKKLELPGTLEKINKFLLANLQDIYLQSYQVLC